MLPPVSAEFRIGTDPELRFTPSGMAICTFRAVASSRKQVSPGVWEDDRSCWVTVTGFNKLAENMAESLQKPDLIVVLGRLEVREWEDDQGKKHYSPEILVDKIGPSLAWATAKMTPVERTNGGGQSRQSSQNAADNDPWQTPPSSQGVWPSQKSDAPPQDDEPPF